MVRYLDTVDAVLGCLHPLCQQVHYTALSVHGKTSDASLSSF